MGVIDMLVSDHSPCTPDLKRPGHSDFMAAWGGISSLQFGFSLAWSQAEERELSLPFLHRLMGKAPARLAGLQERKGQLAEGFDADLVIFAPDETQLVVVRGSEVYSRTEGFKGRPGDQLLLPEEPKL